MVTKKNTESVLDLGCGTGNNLKRFYKRFAVIGVDIDPENIAVCKKKMPNGTWIIGDITNIDLSQFHCVRKIICTEVIEHVDKWEKVIENLKNVRGSTQLYLTTPIKKSEEKLLKIHPSYWKQIGHIYFFEGPELVAALSRTGWEKISVRRINAALYFELRALFKRNAPCIRNTYYDNTILPFSYRIFFQLFRPDLFLTKLKWIPVWIVTLPIGYILNFFWGAGMAVCAVRGKKINDKR